MREIRQSGSEGGESDLPYPYPAQGEALGNRTTHDSALKGAVQASSICKTLPQTGRCGLFYSIA